MINLMLGDCLERMKEIQDGSVDMILCDLPYGTTACKWDSIIPLNELWIEYRRVCKDNGVIALTASQPFTSKLVMSNTEMFRYSWIWEKEQGVNFLTAKKNPMKVHEDVLIFYLDEAQVKGRSNKFYELRKYFADEKKSLGLRSKEITKILGNGMGGHYFTEGVQWILPTEDNYNKLKSTGGFKRDWKELKFIYDSLSEECCITYNPQMTDGKKYTSGLGTSGDVSGNVIKVSTKNEGTRYPRSIQRINREVGLHPTQKPVALMEYLIRTYTKEGETVLDNCMGSGTTGVACVNTKRSFIGIERDEAYFNIAKDRIENAAPRLA